MTAAHCACEYVAHLCPMHKAASAMLAALEAVVEADRSLLGEYGYKELNYLPDSPGALAVAALALARGEAARP